jgi:hypothetical protein
MNTMAKPQFANAQQCLRMGKGSMRKCTIRQQILISIRLWSRDPGQHILAKQRLVGACGEPFAFSGFRAIAAVAHFLAAAVYFLAFGSHS